MAGELAAIAGVGFRHVVEDGLAVLEGRELPIGRREYVLERLTTLLAQAIAGSKIVEEDALFVGSTDKNAFQSYSLLERHIRHHNGWRGKLQGAELAFADVQAGTPLTGAAKSVATNLLQELLESLKREGVGGIPSVPEEIELRRW